MGKEYKFGFVIEGNDSSGTKTLRAVKTELEQLESVKKKGKQSTDAWTEAQDQFGKKMDSARSLAVGLAASLGGMITISYFKGLITDAIDAADNLNDLRFSTNLSVEALSGLQLLAKSSGSTIDVLSAGVVKLSQNMGTNSDKFREMGITAKDPLEALKQLSDRFVAIKDPQDQAAFANDALGRSWKDLAPVLALGGDEIQKVTDRGAKMSGITLEMAENADAYNDSMEVIKLGAQGLVNTIAAGLLPGMADFAGTVAEFAEDGGFERWLDVTVSGVEALSVVLIARATPSFIQYSVQAYAAATATLSTATAAGTLNKAMMLLGGPAGVTLMLVAGLGMLVSSMENSQERAQRLREEIDKLSDSEIANAKAMAQSELEMAQASAARAERTRERSAADERAYQIQAARVVEITDRIAKYDEVLNGVEAQLEATGAATDNAGAQTADYSEKARDLIAELNHKQSALKLSSREQAILTEQLKLGEDATEGEKQAVAEAAGVLFDYEQSLRDAKEEQQRMTKAEQDAAKATADLAARYNDTIASLASEQAQLYMSGREQAIYTELVKLGTSATIEQQRAVAEAAGALYDAEAAHKAAATAADKQAEASKKAAEDSAQEWLQFRDSVADYFVDVVVNGKNASDLIEGFFKSMLARLVAEFATTKLFQFLGFAPASGGNTMLSSFASMFGGGKSGSGSSALGAASNVSSLFGGGLMASGSQFLGGLTGGALGTNSMIATGASTAGAGLGGLIAAIPGWGWALGGLALAGGLLSKDSTPSSNAGLLIHDVAGAKANQKFAVDPFASGFAPVGFARREDQGAAMGVIDQFRGLDATLTDLYFRVTGQKPNFNASTFRSLGTSETGEGDGVFIGQSAEDGKARGNSIASQLDAYARTYVKALGLSSDVETRILAGGDAASIIQNATAIAKEIAAAKVGAPQVDDSAASMRDQIENLVVGKTKSDETAQELKKSSTELVSVMKEVQALIKALAGDIKNCHTILEYASEYGWPAAETA